MEVPDPGGILVNIKVSPELSDWNQPNVFLIQLNLLNCFSTELLKMGRKINNQNCLDLTLPPPRGNII